MSPGSRAAISADGGVARCIVLGGGLKASPLQELCASSALDLIVRPGCSVLAGLIERAHEAVPGMVVTVVYGQPVPAPTLPRASGADSGLVSVVRESQRWRGPAGLLRDECESLSAGASILVIEGSRWLGDSLRPLVAEHVERSAEVTVGVCDDGSPAGVYVIRRSALEIVPKVGFLDLKEQLLGRLLSSGPRSDVRAVLLHGVKAMRTLEDYLAVARSASAVPGGMNDPSLASQWRLIEPGAEVAASADVLGSVVMSGGWIGEGALVARSAVLPGGRVEPGEEVVDAVVQPGEIRRSLVRTRISAAGRRAS